MVDSRTRAAASERILLAVSLCAALAAGALFASVRSLAAQPAERISPEEKELRDIRHEINRIREKELDLRGREEGILRGLDDMEREIELRDRLLKGLMQRRERVLGVLAEARAELEWASEELDGRQGAFLKRLAEMYRLGKYHEYEIMLGSASFVDLVRRYDFLLTIASRDRDIHDRFVQQKREVQGREEALRRTAEEISRIEAETEIERAQLVERSDMRRRLLDDIRTQRRVHEEAITELEASAQRLQRLIGSLEEKREFSISKGNVDAARTELREQRGSLAWPTDGRVVGAFGPRVHPEFGTSTFNNGIDIRAEAGTPIRVVGQGTVDFVSTLPGYGNCVIVNHGDGLYTLYAHASEVLVAQGDRVRAGQVVARVGSTGSLAGDLLHFEIRDGRKPVNPLDWLQRR